MAEKSADGKFCDNRDYGNLLCPALLSPLKLLLLRWSSKFAGQTDTRTGHRNTGGGGSAVETRPSAFLNAHG